MICRAYHAEEIPEIARIIAVADAYDAMTSIRSCRDPIPQEKVREEILKGSGAQFDPVYAAITGDQVAVTNIYVDHERTPTA